MNFDSIISLNGLILHSDIAFVLNNLIIKVKKGIFIN